jgi:Uma2 family endonuclease
MATDVATLHDLEPETEALPAEPEGLYEVVDGQIVEKSMGAYEAQLARLLLFELCTFLKGHELGTAEIELLFLIDKARGLKRRPDVAFVSRERWPIGRRAPHADAWDVIPDLAVEVVSPSNSASDVMRKRGQYLRAGVRQVWVVYPMEQEVLIFDGSKTARLLEREDDLEGGEVLPGFRLALSTLFDDEPPAA